MFWLIWLIFIFIINNTKATDLWKNYETPQKIDCISSYGDYVWIGTGYQGLFKLNKIDGTLKYEIFGIQQIAIDKKGVVYAGSKNGGIAILKDNNWVRFYKGDSGLLGDHIIGPTLDNNDIIWIACNQSVYTVKDDPYPYRAYEAIQFFDNSSWRTKIYNEHKSNSIQGLEYLELPILAIDIVDSNSIYYSEYNKNGGYSAVIGYSAFTQEGNLFASIDYIKVEKKEKNNKIWISGINYSNFTPIIAYNYFGRGSFSNFIDLRPIAVGFTHSSISLAIDNYNNKWFVDQDESNNKYLIKYDDINYIPYTCSDWTPATEITALYADDQGFIWVGTQSDGLFRFDAKNATIVQAAHLTPAEFTLSTAFPNPFNASTTISFTLNKPGKVNLSIYSLTGQKVRELASRNYSAGQHTAVWDGKNENGEIVSSGVYLARMESGGVSKVVRMAMVK